MAYKQELWDEAKKKCHLGEEEIRMAKEMGLNPKSLIKNIPNKKELWKAPVKDWIHDMYDERQEKVEQKAKKNTEYSEKAAIDALYNELSKGIDSMKKGDVYTIDEVWEKIDKINPYT